MLATDFRESAMAATQWATELASDISVPLLYLRALSEAYF